jgi:hypothetical protein
MKKSAILIGLFLLISSAQAQNRITGNGNVTTKKVSTGSYDKVDVAGFYDVFLVSGKEGDITIEGESNLLEHISITVEGSTLRIATEKGKRINTSRGKNIVVTVPFESLNEVSLTGSGDIKGKSTIKATNFETNITGSGDITLDVEASQIDARITGSGDLVLKGKTGEFSCEITGSGDLSAFGLESGKVNSTVSGSGDCKVTCTDSLQARISGSGDIQYKGDPKHKDTKVSGSGSISKA